MLLMQVPTTKFDQFVFALQLRDSITATTGRSPSNTEIAVRWACEEQRTAMSGDREQMKGRKPATLRHWVAAATNCHSEPSVWELLQDKNNSADEEDNECLNVDLLASTVRSLVSAFFVHMNAVFFLRNNSEKSRSRGRR